MTGSSKKTLVAFLTAVIVFAGIFFAAPSPARADFGVSGLVQQAFDVARDLAVKLVVNMINQQTVAWIQGTGQPQFIQDFGSFLFDNIDRETANIIDQYVGTSTSALNFLCSEIQPSVQAILPSLYEPAWSTQQSSQYGCSLRNIVGNVEDFADDFSKGGWRAFTVSVADPSSNMYGAILSINDRIRAQAAKQFEENSVQAQTGGGFLGVGRCLDPQGASRDDCKEGKWQILTPDSIAEDLAKNITGNESSYTTNVKSIISAIINAAISLLTNSTKGLAFGDYNPSSGGGANPATSQIPLKPYSMDTQVRFVGMWQYGLDSKSVALDQSASPTVRVLQSAQNNGCNAENSLNIAKGYERSLKNQVDDYQKLIPWVNYISDSLSKDPKSAEGPALDNLIRTLAYDYPLLRIGYKDIKKMQEMCVKNQSEQQFGGINVFSANKECSVAEWNNKTYKENVQLRVENIINSYGIRRSLLLNGLDTEEWQKQFQNGTYMASLLDEKERSRQRYEDALSFYVQDQCVGPQKTASLIRNGVSPLVSEWSYAADSAASSMRHAESLFGSLTAMQAISCGGVEQSRIDEVQEIVTQLEGISSALSQAVKDSQDAMPDPSVDVNGESAKGFLRAYESMRTAYSNQETLSPFSEKTASLIDRARDGSLRADANAFNAYISREDQNAQQQLDSCSSQASTSP